MSLSVSSTSTPLLMSKPVVPFKSCPADLIGKKKAITIVRHAESRCVLCVVSRMSCLIAHSRLCNHNVCFIPPHAPVFCVCPIRYNEYTHSWSVILTCRCCCDPMLIDAPLSSTGEQQARRTGTGFVEEQFLSNHAVELIVVSPLQRALQVCLSLMSVM
jgi:hypothetical protein